MPPVSTISDSYNLAPLESPTAYTPDQQVTISKLVRGVVILRSMYQQRPIMTLKVSKSLSHRRNRDVRQVAHGLLLPIAIRTLQTNTKKPKQTSKSNHACNIDELALRANKTLLIGERLKRYFAGYGGAIGTVTRYILEQDAYELQYSDGHVDIIPFEDILALIPKS